MHAISYVSADAGTARLEGLVFYTLSEYSSLHASCLVYSDQALSVPFADHALPSVNLCRFDMNDFQVIDVLGGHGMLPECYTSTLPALSAQHIFVVLVEHMWSEYS